MPPAVRTKESQEGTGFLNCLLLLSGRDTAQGAKSHLLREVPGTLDEEGLSNM